MKILRAFICLGFLLVCLSAPASGWDNPYEWQGPNITQDFSAPQGWDSSPFNWDNNINNFENSPFNFRNSPNNFKNSPLKYDNPRIIRDNKGNAKGYIVPKPDGGANAFDFQGNRIFYLPAD